MAGKNLERIAKDTKIWTPDLDITLPINGSDIPNFREWVNWNGWKGYSPAHEAFDFAAYIDKDSRCILGLPEETPVRAIADGFARFVSNKLLESVGYKLPEGWGYGTTIEIEHGKKGSGRYSIYHHVIPQVDIGQVVGKGDVIATLHKDSGNEEGRLVHLHFGLTNGWNNVRYVAKARHYRVDPATIFPSIAKPEAQPQGETSFQIPGLENQPELHIAHFKRLLVNI